MRHGNKLKTLGREASHRKAMLNNLATSIILKGLAEEQMDRQVRTTVQKAKAVRGLVDRLITYAKKGDLTAKRSAAKFVKNKEAFKGLFGVLGERYQERPGGYSRILKLSSTRHGDNAEMAIITLVEDEVAQKKKKKPTRKKSAAKAKSAPEKAEEEIKSSNADAAHSAEPAEGIESESVPKAESAEPAEKPKKKAAPKAKKEDPPKKA